MSPEIHQIQRRENPPLAQTESQPRPGRTRDAALQGSRGAVAHDDLRLEQAADGSGDRGKIAVVDGLDVHLPPLAEDSSVFSQSGGPRLTVQAQSVDLRAGIEQARQSRKANVHAQVHPAPLLQCPDQALALHQIAEAGRL